MRLNDEESRRIEYLFESPSVSPRIKTRLKILLILDTTHNQTPPSYTECGHYLGISRTTVKNVVNKFLSGGINEVISNFNPEGRYR